MNIIKKKNKTILESETLPNILTERNEKVDAHDYLGISKESTVNEVRYKKEKKKKKKRKLLNTIDDSDNIRNTEVLIEPHKIKKEITSSDDESKLFEDGPDEYSSDVVNTKKKKKIPKHLDTHYSSSDDNDTYNVATNTKLIKPDRIKKELSSSDDEVDDSKQFELKNKFQIRKAEKQYVDTMDDKKIPSHIQICLYNIKKEENSENECGVLNKSKKHKHKIEGSNENIGNEEMIVDMIDDQKMISPKIKREKNTSDEEYYSKKKRKKESKKRKHKTEDSNEDNGNEEMIVNTKDDEETITPTIKREKNTSDEEYYSKKKRKKESKKRKHKTEDSNEDNGNEEMIVNTKDDEETITPTVKREKNTSDEEYYSKKKRKKESKKRKHKTEDSNEDNGNEEMIVNTKDDEETITPTIKGEKNTSDEEYYSKKKRKKESKNHKTKELENSNKHFEKYSLTDNINKINQIKVSKKIKKVEKTMCDTQQSSGDVKSLRFKNSINDKSINDSKIFKTDSYENEMGFVKSGKPAIKIMKATLQHNEDDNEEPVDTEFTATTDEYFFELLTKADVEIDFEIPQLHTLTSKTVVRHINIKLRKKIAELKIPHRLGYFTPKEDKIIAKNWRKLCLKYNLPDCPDVFARWRNILNISKYSRARRQAVLFLAQGLPDRTLPQVFHRFIHSIGTTTKGKFTENEKEAIDLFSTAKEFNGFTQQFLAGILGRDLPSIWRYLKRQKIANEKIIRRMKWDLESSEKFIKVLLENVNVALNKPEKSFDLEVLRNYKICHPVWLNVAKELDLTIVQLKTHWYSKLHVQLFVNEPIYLTDMRIKILKIIHAKKYEFWQDISWKDILTQFENYTTYFLWKIFYDFLYRFCVDKIKYLGDAVKILHNKYVIEKEHLKNKKLLQIKFTEDRKLVFREQECEKHTNTHSKKDLPAPKSKTQEEKITSQKVQQ